MAKFFGGLVLALFAGHAHATIWFGFSDASGNPRVVGLSSGPIAIGEDDALGFVGHVRLQRHFIGIGAFPLDRHQLQTVRTLELESATSQEFLAKMEREFPSHRFLIAADDGTILMTAGETGCNSTNVYCGSTASGSFHVVGGGLVDENVILSARQKFELESTTAPTGGALACGIIDAIVDSGGEIKNFDHGVVWTNNPERLIKEEAAEADLVLKLKAQLCPELLNGEDLTLADVWPDFELSDIADLHTQDRFAE